MADAGMVDAAADASPIPQGLRELASSCHICLDELSNPLLTPCGHIFCRICITDWYRSRTEASQPVTCPYCRHELLRRPEPVGDANGIDIGESDDADYGEPGHIDEGAGQVRNWSTVIDVLDDSGLLDGSYTAGTNVQIGSTSGAQWKTEIADAMHYLLRPGPPEIPSAPAVIRSVQSARDAIIFSNILVAAYETRLPNLHRNATGYVHAGSSRVRQLRSQWNFLVTTFAEMLLEPGWDGQRNSASAMIERLREAILIECESHDDLDIFESMPESAWFGFTNWSGCRSMVTELVQYVVSRAVHRRMDAIIAQAS